MWANTSRPAIEGGIEAANWEERIAYLSNKFCKKRKTKKTNKRKPGGYFLSVHFNVIKTF